MDHSTDVPIIRNVGLQHNEYVTGTGTEVNPESWTQLKGSNEKGI
jgi:hypothetical protein